MSNEAKVLMYACGNRARLDEAQNRLSSIFAGFDSETREVKIEKCMETDEAGKLELRDCLIVDAGFYNYDFDGMNDFAKEFEDLRWCMGTYYCNCGIAEFRASDYNSKKTIGCNTDEDSNYEAKLKKTIGENGLEILIELDPAGDFFIREEVKVIVYACGKRERLEGAEDCLNSILANYKVETKDVRIEQFMETDETGTLAMRDCLIADVELYNYYFGGMKDFAKEYADLRWCMGVFYIDNGLIEFRASGYKSKKTIECCNEEDGDCKDILKEIIGENGLEVMENLYQSEYPSW